jgi:hypothetical protein
MFLESAILHQFYPKSTIITLKIATKGQEKNFPRSIESTRINGVETNSNAGRSVDRKGNGGQIMDLREWGVKVPLSGSAGKPERSDTGQMEIDARLGS